MVLVSEPNDYKTGVGTGSGYRIAAGSTLGKSRFIGSVYALAVHGNRQTKSEFGAQIGYGFW